MNESVWRCLDCNIMLEGIKHRNDHVLYHLNANITLIEMFGVQAAPTRGTLEFERVTP